MAVETRYVVVRGGNEIMTFADKKAADEYDRMLDMADNLAVLLEDSTLALDDKGREELSIYLAKNREEVLIALMAKKRSAPVKAAIDDTPAAEDKAKDKAKDKAEDKATTATKSRKKKAE